MKISCLLFAGLLVAALVCAQPCAAQARVRADPEAEIPTLAGLTLAHVRPVRGPDLWAVGMQVRPLPRWRATLVRGFARRVSGASDSAGTDTVRTAAVWETTLTAVLRPGPVEIALPAVWRRHRATHTWNGESTWDEVGTGVSLSWSPHPLLTAETGLLWIAAPTGADPWRGTYARAGGRELGVSARLTAWVF